MREIKFRCFDTISPKMYVGHSLSISANGSIHFLGDDGNWTEYDNDDRIKVMQFTGLKDKAGVDIYEGDILQEGDKTVYGPVNLSEVNLGDDEFALGYQAICWNMEYRDKSGFAALVESGKDNYGTASNELLIIGNIYSNPELLPNAGLIK